MGSEHSCPRYFASIGAQHPSPPQRGRALIIPARALPWSLPTFPSSSSPQSNRHLKLSYFVFCVNSPSLLQNATGPGLQGLFPCSLNTRADAVPDAAGTLNACTDFNPPGRYFSCIPLLFLAGRAATLRRGKLPAWIGQCNSKVIHIDFYSNVSVIGRQVSAS